MKKEDCIEKLETIQSRLEMAQKLSKLGYFEFAVKTRKMHWSSQMYELFGFSSQNLSRKITAIRKAILPEDFPLYKQTVQKLLKQRQSVEGNIRIKNKQSGQTVHCRFHAGLVVEDNQQKIVGTFQDLTEMINMQQELNAAKNKAEDLNMAKSYFLAQASHDLRQPMQALKILIYNLFNSGLTEKQTDIAKKIEYAGNNLNNLLDNFLDVSKLESGGFSAAKEEFMLCDMLSRIYLEFAEISLNKGLDVRFVNCSHQISSDPVLIERIIRNFLSNAYKYTKNKILLGCRRNEDGLKIMVFDNGCGIDEKDLPYIFDDFFQSSKIADNKRQGAGLGLSIVRKIAHLIGGRLDVKSTIKKGSCFILQLPLK